MYLFFFGVILIEKAREMVQYNGIMVKEKIKIKYFERN